KIPDLIVFLSAGVIRHQRHDKLIQGKNENAYRRHKDYSRYDVERSALLLPFLIILCLSGSLLCSASSLCAFPSLPACRGTPAAPALLPAFRPSFLSAPDFIFLLRPARSSPLVFSVHFLFSFPSALAVLMLFSLRAAPRPPVIPFFLQQITAADVRTRGSHPQG